MPIDKRSFEDIEASVADAIGRVPPTQLLADMISLVAYVHDAERERNEAQGLLLRAERVLAPLCLRHALSGEGPPEDLEAWIDEIRPHVEAVIKRRESLAQGEER